MSRVNTAERQTLNRGTYGAKAAFEDVKRDINFQTVYGQ